MVNIEIELNKFWNLHETRDSKLYFKGFFYSHTVSELNDVLNFIELEYLNEFINSLRGNFAFIFKNSKYTIGVVDRIRSSELNFFQYKSDFYISPNIGYIFNLEFFKKSINQDAVRQIAMSGYTIGDDTLYDNCKSLSAGQYVMIVDDKLEVFDYFKYFDAISKQSYDELKIELTKVTLDLFKKIIKKIGDRQIVIPLSAGNDSRLVASIFHHLGVKNVLCYSYGQKTNFESKISKIIAEKLEYKWVFIPVSYSTERSFYNSNKYKEFLGYSFSNSGISFIQSLSTIGKLKESNLINKDSVFINGNSGDFISGGHINKLYDKIESTNSIEDLKDITIDTIIAKHVSLWGYLKTTVNLKNIKEKLYLTVFEDFQKITRENIHLIYENYEYANRQSKYVVSGQRVYEFYNYDWILPLWDDEYLLFWRKIPKEFKKDQLLYVDMLRSNNFGGVWDNKLPVNDKKIFPIWIRPLRFLFKIFFYFLGKNGRLLWKRFDISFFYYWMDPVLLSCSSKYYDWIKDFKKRPRSPISWISKDYINFIKNSKV